MDTNEPGPSMDVSRLLWLMGIGMLVGAIVVSGMGLVVHWADFDVDTRVGPAEFKLVSDFSQGGIEYTGSAQEYGVEVDGELTFIEGTGEYQERIGFLKGTAKERTNTITPYTQIASAEMDVRVQTETIPWWVVGVGVPCSVEVELVEWTNVSSLTVDRVFLEYRRDVGGEMRRKPVWDDDVSDSITQVGQVLRYETKLKVDEDWGQFELFGMVNVSMEDSEGRAEIGVFRSYSTEPKTVTLWTIPTGQGAKIALTIAALPVSVAGLAVAVVSLVLMATRRRGAFAAAMTSGVLLLLGPLFFHLGVSELATLVGYPDDLSFSGLFWVSYLACALAFGAGGHAFVVAMVGAQEGGGGPDEGDSDLSHEGQGEWPDDEEAVEAVPDDSEEDIE